MLRSIGAVVVGFLLIGVLSFGGDFVIRSAAPGSFDVAGAASSPAVLVAMLAYVGVFAVFGCYLTARLAPNRPMAHALVLGALGLAFNVAGTIAMWDTAPAWYHAVALAMVMPYAWLGGRIRERELSRTGPAPRALAV